MRLIEDAMVKGEDVHCHNEAHKLKSASGYLGFERVAEVRVVLEQWHSGVPPVPLLEDLRRELAVVREQLGVSAIRSA